MQAIQVRLPTHSHEILINPFGLSYHEINASSLIKVDLAGNVIDQGSTSHSINQVRFVWRTRGKYGENAIMPPLTKKIRPPPFG